MAARRSRARAALLVAAALALASWGACRLLVSGAPPLVAAGPDADADSRAGLGGDAALLEALRSRGEDLRALREGGLPGLRARLAAVAPGRAGGLLLYGGRLVNNLSARGVPGFLVCPRAAPGSPEPSGADGVPLACAITDRHGRFTFVGLPRNAAVTLTFRRRGFLQLAFTTNTVHPLDYEQDYVATVPAYLAARAYADARFPFSAAEETRTRLGELALTVIRERRAAGDPLHGFASPGMYAGNGVAGARFGVFGDDGSGRFALPYRLDGLVYADTIEGRAGATPVIGALLHAFASAGLFRRFLRGVEVPAPERRDTSAVGLAILKAMPPGLYEAEVAHETLDCLPARDAWPGTTPRRARFEVVERTLGDVRFACEERSR